MRRRSPGEVLRLRARGLPDSLPAYRTLQGLSGPSPKMGGVMIRTRRAPPIRSP